MAGSESDLLFYILWLAICGKFSLINLKQKQKQKKIAYTWSIWPDQQGENCNADRTTWKLTLQDINTTPKELKTERDFSHRQLFRPFGGSSVWRNNQRKFW